MTTATVPASAPAPARVAGSDGQVRFGRICRSEWTKFRSVRSTWWSLAVGVVLAVGLGLLATMDAAGSPSASPSQIDIAAGSQFGVLFAQLAILVLATLSITGEYGTGMVRSSMTVVPRRVPVLLGKAVVLVAVVFPVSLVTALVSFGLGNVLWQSQGHDGASLTAAGVPGVLLGVPLYLSLAAVFALAVGTLIRNTAATVSTLVAVFFVLPMVAGGVAGLREIAPYLPSNAGGALSHQTLVTEPMAGWPGLALFAGYTVVLVVAAINRLRRTDV